LGMCRRRGFTLAEVIVALGVLVLLGGAMVAFYSSGARYFARSSMFSQVSAAATMAAKSIAADAQQAMAVKSGTSLPAEECSSAAQLVLAMPAIDPATGYNQVPLQEGAWVRYYLSDKSGAYGSTGPYLWRGVKRLSEGVWRTDKCLARSVTGLHFGYAPGLAQASRVVISVTAATSGGGGRSTVASESTEALLRNR